jgi:hypothetical protein
MFIPTSLAQQLFAGQFGFAAEGTKPNKSRALDYLARGETRVMAIMKAFCSCCSQRKSLEPRESFT